MNRETLKQAIADAKTIKETAIANAKLALEEAFTPQLTAMFAEKLNEMEDEVKEEESMEETFNIDELLAELDGIDEYAEEQPDRDMDGDGDVDADDVKMMKEEDLMLEEMSDEEIEELVAQVIDDMIASGKLMAGEGEEEGEEEEIDMEDTDMDDMDMDDMEGEEESEKEEIDIDETLAEILAEIEKEEVKEEMVSEMSENAMAIMGALSALGLIPIAYATAKGHEMAKAGKFGSKVKAAIEKFEKIASGSGSGTTGGGDLPEAKEMEETINELRNELNEVNLLNAKLLYTNKIFKAKNLTESDKVKVLNAFDKAENVKGVKLVYETLTENLKTTSIVKKSPVKESLGSASRAIAPATPKQPIVEVNEVFARMQKIAGIKK
jgi:hypothetical protein